MPPRVTSRPTHHLTLTDGDTTVGLILCSPRGEPDPRAIREGPMPKTSLQISQGDPTYGSYQLPFSPISQKDFSGGRAQENIKQDSTRFYDAWRVDTRMGDLILGPKQTNTSGTYKTDIVRSGATHLVDPGTPFASSFTPATTIDVRSVTTTINALYPGLIHFKIYSDVAGKPGASLATGSVWNDTTGVDVSITSNITRTLTGGTKYWMGITITNTGDLHYGAKAGDKIMYYGGGDWWDQAADSSLSFTLSTHSLGTSKFFEYKGALHFVLQPDDDSVPKLYLNGYRGLVRAAPTDLSVMLTSLDLGSVSLTGKIVKITAGTGASERVSWRLIKDNTQTGTNDSITVYPAWNIAHTTATEFVILGCDSWSQITGHTLTKPVTDVMVIDDIVYFAQGDSTNIQRGRLNAGTWTWQAEGTNKATFLTMIPDTTGKRKVWRALAATAKVAKSDVKAWGADLSFGADIVCGKPQYKITNLIPYGTPQIPWVLKEDGIGSIAADFYAPVPLTELESVRDERNGRAATQFGVYLFLSMLDGAERFYDNRLDDLGPNRDEGFPIGRQGPIVDMIAYPGGIITALDCGHNGYSSLLYWNQIGWHEMFQGPLGQRIHSIYVQVIPGDTVDRLWFSEEELVSWLPLSPNPRKQAGYKFIGQGHVITSWHQGSFGEINKYWSSLTLHTDGLSEGQQYITAYYQIDAEGDADPWHLIGTFAASPSQKLPISAEHNVASKRIRFKLVLNTGDDSKTPRLKAMTIQAVTRVPPAKSWSITVLVASRMTDLQGSWAEMDGTELRAQLATWANSNECPTPLLMRAADPAYDDKYVFIDAGTVMPIELTSEVGGKVHAKKALTMSIFEAED